MGYIDKNNELLEHIVKMNNIKHELLAHVVSMDNVKAVQLKHERHTHNLKSVQLFHLPEGYSEEVLADFLRNIDFSYDCPYGWQELFGFIWWKDGTWSSRYAYDGKEWWVHNEEPTYPLNRKEMMEL